MCERTDGKHTEFRKDRKCTHITENYKNVHVVLGDEIPLINPEHRNPSLISTATHEGQPSNAFTLLTQNSIV